MVIYLMKNRKLLFFSIIGVVIVAAVITIIVILNKSEKTELVEEKLDIEKLEMQFNNMFDNQENEYVSNLYHIEREQSGKYEIEADIPYIHVSNEFDKKINKEINDFFVNKIIQIYNESTSYNILKVYYASSINDNILSIAIKCILKEGRNAQRTIIKTYNYDIENNKEIKITDLLTENKKESLQNKVNEKIKAAIKKDNTIASQGYNIYKRDENSSIYLLENSSEFYIKGNILYVIYCYGNNKYTSEMDLVIDKIDY